MSMVSKLSGSLTSGSSLELPDVILTETQTSLTYDVMPYFFIFRHSVLVSI